MAEQVDVVVVGGGQAGLATSYELTARGVEHVVLERGRVGQTWRDRWDSFCLVTPNWTVRLPGRPYDGDDADGFMPRDDIVAYLERYAAAARAPVREEIEVLGVERRSDGRFALRTSDHEIRAGSVVLATGAYQRPHRPPGWETLPANLLTIDVEGYRRERALPPGRVLVVGSGQSGCQITEELRAAGRDVVLACGKAPWSPRRIAGRDIIWWLVESGFMDAPVESLSEPAARLAGNILATGHQPSHDLSLRTLRDAGVVLAGRFRGATERHVHFGDDLAESVAWGDGRYRQVMELVRGVATDRGIDLPHVAEPPPFDPDEAPARIDLAGLGAVILTGGFRPDYRAWLPWPEAFDDLGFPLNRDGASTVVPGLYFVGVHFLRTRKSSLLIGVGEDAALVAASAAARR